MKYSLAEVWWGHFTEFTAPSSSPENFLVCLLGDRRPWRKYTSGIKSPYTVFNFSSFPTHWKKLHHQSILLKASLLLLSDKSKSYTVFWKATSWKIRNSPKYHHSSVTSYIFHWEFLFSSPHLTFLSPWRRSKVSSHVDGLWTWPLYYDERPYDNLIRILLTISRLLLDKFFLVKCFWICHILFKWKCLFFLS